MILILTHICSPVHVTCAGGGSMGRFRDGLAVAMCTEPGLACLYGWQHGAQARWGSQPGMCVERWERAGS